MEQFVSEIVAMYKSKYKPFESIIEEKDTFKKYEIYRDKETLNRIVMANIGLVLSVCKNYFIPHGFSFDDIFQEGLYALVKAIKNFDLSKNYLFSSYAYPYVDKYMRKYVKKNSSYLKVSYKFIELFFKFRTAESKLAKKLGHRPTDEELASELQVQLYKIKQLKRFELMNNVRFFDEELENGKSVINSRGGRDSSDTLYDVIENEDVVPIDAKMDNDDIIFLNALNKLKSNEREMVIRLFGLNGEPPINSIELARILGISHQRVSLVVRDALKKLYEEPSLRTLIDNKKSLLCCKDLENDLKISLYQKLPVLTSEQLGVIELIYGLNGYGRHKIPTVGRILRLTNFQVRLIEQESLSKMEIVKAKRAQK